MAPTPKTKFIVQPHAQWYSLLTPLAIPPETSSQKSVVSPAQHADLLARATQLHSTDCTTFQNSSASNSSSSEASFLQKILHSGTLSDRLSALTLLVQSSPVHNVKALEILKGMGERGKGKGGRDESLKALRCVVDWWVGGGAPARKLKYFRDQPLTNPGVIDAHLVLWYFEDWLKKFFFSILQILETLSLDPLPYVRTQSLNLIATLLREKPEQEQNLLRLLVNKLGDNEKKICSKASYHLLQVLQVHPSMKAVIVREIISLVLRPVNPTASTTPSEGASNKHIRFTDEDPPSTSKKKQPKHGETKSSANTHARYYATITFNQIVLTPSEKDKDVARQLIDVYFTLFKEVLGESKESVDEGEIGRKGAEENEGDEVKKDKHGRIRSKEDKKKGKGKMEAKGAAGFAEVEDANSKLVSAILTGVNRAMPFARIDKDDSALSKHIDTLFLITHKSTFNISLQALVLIQQTVSSLLSSQSTTSSIKGKKPFSSATKSITTRYYRSLYASLFDPRLATSSKQAMYLNLLFKSIKGCVGVEFTEEDGGKLDGIGWGGECVRALVRRFIQVLVSGGGGATEFVAGGLFLLGELFSTIPGLRDGLSARKSDGKEKDGEMYDPKKRDPQYAHASSSPIWELTPLLHHYHPAIALHARQLLSGTPLTASADLSLNTLSHFLDRFVYKNAKKLPTKGEDADESTGISGGRGASLMQPAASALDGSVSGVKLIKGEIAGRRGGETRVNESAFLRKKVEDVPVDQVFFHKFFTRKNEKERAKAAKIGKRKGDGSDSDGSEEGSEDEGDGDGSDLGEKESGEDEPVDSAAEEDGSELDEDEVWKAMKATIPKMDGDEDLLDDSGEDGEDDEIPSGLDEDNGEEDSEDDAKGDGEDEEHPDDEDDALSLAEASDDEDLLSLDGEVPSGLIDFDGSDDGSDEQPNIEDEEEWGGIGGGSSGSGKGRDKKRKRKEETGRARRKKLRALPTFASYEDYAKMIEDGPEDDI